MIISVPMTVAPSARTELNALLATKEPGSVISMLIGYYYDGERKIPRLEIGTYSPEVLDIQLANCNSFGDPLLHDCDGITVALVLADTVEWLEGRTLVFADGSYQIKSN